MAYPKGVKDKVPGLVQVHGGGQRANKHMVVVDAANGYASISLNWGGRELEDQKPGRTRERTGGRLIRPKSMSATTFASLPMKKP
jgi:cephalosporin-C deacetylase-like acetyl esterase